MVASALQVADLPSPVREGTPGYIEGDSDMCVHEKVFLFVL